MGLDWQEVPDCAHVSLQTLCGQYCLVDSWSGDSQLVGTTDVATRLEFNEGGFGELVRGDERRWLCEDGLLSARVLRDQGGCTYMVMRGDSLVDLQEYIGGSRCVNVKVGDLGHDFECALCTRRRFGCHVRWSLLGVGKFLHAKAPHDWWKKRFKKCRDQRSKAGFDVRHVRRGSISTSSAHGPQVPLSLDEPVFAERVLKRASVSTGAFLFLLSRWCVAKTAPVTKSASLLFEQLLQTHLTLVLPLSLNISLRGQQFSFEIAQDLTLDLGNFCAMPRAKTLPASLILKEAEACESMTVPAAFFAAVVQQSVWKNSCPHLQCYSGPHGPHHMANFLRDTEISN